MPTIRDVGTIQSRLEWIKQERGWSWSHFAEKCGLARSYFSTVRGEAGCNPTQKTLRKIAKAAEVRFEWLSGGKGPWQPYENREAPQDSPGASRDLAATAARMIGLSERAIEAVIALQEPEQDPGAEWWFHQIQAEHARVGKPRTR